MTTTRTNATVEVKLRGGKTLSLPVLVFPYHFDDGSGGMMVGNFGNLNTVEEFTVKINPEEVE